MAMTPALSESTERPLGTSVDETDPVEHQTPFAFARPVLRRVGADSGLQQGVLR